MSKSKRILFISNGIDRIKIINYQQILSPASIYINISFFYLKYSAVYMRGNAYQIVSNIIINLSIQIVSVSYLIVWQQYHRHEIKGNFYIILCIFIFCRLLLCTTKRNIGPRQDIRYAKLFMLSCEYFRMGNESNVKMERGRLNSKGKNGSRYSECYIDQYEIGPIFFYKFRFKRQNLRDVISSMAKCSYGSTNVGTRNVAMGMFFTN